MADAGQGDAGQAGEPTQEEVERAEPSKEDLSPSHKLVLEYAYKVYAEVEGRSRHLDSKASASFTYTGLVGSLMLPAALSLVKDATGFWENISLVIMLAAGVLMLITAWLARSSQNMADTKTFPKLVEVSTLATTYGRPANLIAEDLFEAISLCEDSRQEIAIRKGRRLRLVDKMLLTGTAAALVSGVTAFAVRVFPKLTTTQTSQWLVPIAIVSIPVLLLLGIGGMMLLTEREADESKQRE